MSHRLEKINELLRQEVGQIILEEEEFGPGVLVTILQAQITRDRREADIIFSVLPTAKGAAIFKKLSAHAFALWQILTKRLKMNPIPHLHFILNEDETASQHVEKIISHLNI